jgi:hypothetical protein
MGASGPPPDPRVTVELSSAAVELIVLRRALQAARDEARSALISARRAEKALARQRARTVKWQKKCEEYDRITSIISRLSHGVDRARAMLRRGLRALYSTLGSWLTSDVRARSVANNRRQPSDEDCDRTGHDEEPAIKAGSLETHGRVLELVPPGESKRNSPHFSGELSTKSISPVEHRTPDLRSLSVMTPRGRIAAVLHLYYPELWPELRDALGAISEPFDLFVTLTSGHSDEAANWVRIDCPTAQIITLENHGRDIFPFVTLINSGVLFQYKVVCKLHTKRSMRRNDGDDWRRALVTGVLSDSHHVARILGTFDTDPDLGIVVANGSLRTDERSWLRHQRRVNELCARIGMPAPTGETGYPGFPAGSIYWIRSSLLRPMESLGLTAVDFEPEPLLDFCTPHAIERLVGHFCREAGMYVGAC